MRARATVLGSLAVLAALCALGAALGEYDTGLLTTAFIYGIVAVSLDLVWGYAGTPDLGHALWFGVGALTVGVATTRLDQNGLLLSVHGGAVRYGLAVVLGMLVAMAVAGVVARFSFSAKGSPFYIAVVTLALSTVATTLYTQFPRRTGGDNGLFGFAPIGIPARTWYFVALGALAVVTAGALVLVRSDAGLVLRAVRDNDARTRYFGYDVERVKTIAFMGGAGLAAFAGGLYALVFGLVSADLFSFLFATQMLVWVAVGGRGTIIGPVVGAVGLQLVGAHLSASFPTQWALIEGALFVLIVMFLPDGVLPPVTRLLARLTGGARRWAAPGRSLTLDPAGPPERPTSSPVLACQGVEFGYGSLRVLRGVDLDVARGELLCVVGPNGAGKTTLLSVLADGNLRIRGHIRYELGGGASHRRRPAHRIARYGVARKFQAPALFASLTVAEAVLLARHNGRLPSLWRRSREVAVSPPVLDIVAATGVAGRDDELTDTLAHGLKQGVEIACAVAARPQVLLLDEPTAGLTGNEREVVGAVLRRLVGNGMTVILIEHDLDFVNQVADRVAVLHEGRVIEDGPPATVSESAAVREAYLGTAIS